MFQLNFFYVQVFEIPLERCSNYTSCTDCTSSRDPLCGWCALEQYCSRDIYCPGSSSKGHWVNNAEQCIVFVSLAINSMDVDLIKNVSCGKHCLYGQCLYPLIHHVLRVSDCVYKVHRQVHNKIMQINSIVQKIYYSS